MTITIIFLLLLFLSLLSMICATPNFFIFFIDSLVSNQQHDNKQWNQKDKPH